MRFDTLGTAFGAPEQLSNPAHLLRANATSFGQKSAIISASGQSMSFAELEARSDQHARVLQQAGIGLGCKTILMVAPGPDLYVVIFALFKLGAVPIVVDPGMGLNRLLHCYQSVAAEGFVGITMAHLVRLATPQFFPALKSIVWLRDGQLRVTRSNPDTALQADASKPVAIAATTAQDLAMINFTTGSTGPAKPVEATYGMAMAMMAMLQQHLGLTHQDRELVSLPLLGVIAVCIGCTAVIADMNPSKPAEADPEKIVDAIRQYQITTMFGSPALLDRIARYGTQNGIHLPSLRCVNAGGAPITLATLAEFQTLLSDTAQLHVTYGATEGLPLASISARKLLGDMRSLIEDGQGTALGHAIHPVQVRIIRMHDGALPIWRDDLLISGQEVGEIIISGPNISTAYYQAPEADAAHKIREQNGAECVIWHRTGDLAWRSEDAQLIFCGRMSHRVRCANGELLFSVAAEGISNAHPKVHRSALVGVQLQGASQAVMCIELREAASPAQEQAIRQELLGLLQQHASTKQVRTILFHRSFPVDIRHNAKIERPKLTQWAQHELSRKPSSTNQALALKLIPIFGWLYILLGLLIDLPPGFWTWCWYIDIFLSVVVHAAQMPLGISIGKLHGYSRREAALQTFIFGATWWKPLRFSQTNPTPAPAREKLQ